MRQPWCARVDVDGSDVTERPWRGRNGRTPPPHRNRRRARPPRRPRRRRKSMWAAMLGGVGYCSSSTTASPSSSELLCQLVMAHGLWRSQLEGDGLWRTRDRPTHHIRGTWAGDMGRAHTPSRSFIHGDVAWAVLLGGSSLLLIPDPCHSVVKKKFDDARATLCLQCRLCAAHLASSIVSPLHSPTATSLPLRIPCTGLVVMSAGDGKLRKAAGAGRRGGTVTRRLPGPRGGGLTLS